jgi:transmembrane protein TMEM260 (protein O-mannosyltransferase)
MATSTIVQRPARSEGRETAPDLDERPSYLAAGIVTLAVLILYLVTLAPSTAMWDTSEYIAAAYTLGLPHPPGNPLFVLIGRVFSIIPLFGPNVATRINVLAALCSAVSAGMWFLITERVLVGWFPQRWQRITGGAIAAAIGATAFTVWNQSVVNEKVYTVSLVGIAIISWLMIRWSDDPDGRRADRILVLVAYVLGLGYANHMGGMLAAPAAALAVVVRRPRTLLRWRLLLACVGALIFGITPFAIQPIRAAWNPPLNEGEPTACRTGLHFACTFSKGTYDAFMYNFNRGQYGKPDLSDRQAPFTAQVDMWWFYFKWQWLRDPQLKNQVAQGVLGGLFLVLGLFGAWVHFQRDRRSFWYFGTYMLTVTLILIYYLNFKYGSSQSPELGDSVAREVRDRDYFFLWSFSAWGVWAALGLMYIWENLAALFGTVETRYARQTVVLPSRESLLKTTPILLLAGIPLFTNLHTAPRRGQTYTRDFAHDLLDSVEPYGVLVTVGDNDTFPLWYAQEVEGIRKDVVVANTSLLNTDWYTRQIVRRPVFTYDAAKGPAAYRNQQWAKPAGPPLKMTMDEADSVPPYWQIDKPMVFKAGCHPEPNATCDIQAVIPPHLLQRADLFVLRMIQDSYPARPIYFSRTSGGYARELGLGDHVLTQGLAAKVFVPPKASTRDTMNVAGDGWMDVKRTTELWNNDFVGPKSVIRTNDWIDQPSVGIPYLYVATGLELSEALRSRNDNAEANQVWNTAKQVASAVHLERLIGDQPPAAEQSPLVPSESAQGVQLPVKPPPAQKAQDQAKPKATKK